MNAILNSIKAREELVSIVSHMAKTKVDTGPFGEGIFTNIVERLVEDISIEERIAKLLQQDYGALSEDVLDYVMTFHDSDEIAKMPIKLRGQEFSIIDVLNTDNKELHEAAYAQLLPVAREAGYNDVDVRSMNHFEQGLEFAIHETNRKSGKDATIIPGLAALNGDYSPDNIDNLYGKEWPELAAYVKALSNKNGFGRSYVIRKVERSRDVTFWNVFPTKYYGKNPHKCLRIYREAVKVTPESKQIQYRVSVF